MVVSTGRLRSKLKELQFAQILPERGISMMISVTAHDMCAMWLMVYRMYKGLIGVRLGQVAGGIGPRDYCMRGDRSTSETGALDGGRGVVWHGGKDPKKAAGNQRCTLGVERGLAEAMRRYHRRWTCRRKSNEDSIMKRRGGGYYTAPVESMCAARGK
jgi:hypothetical protein